MLVGDRHAGVAHRHPHFVAAPLDADPQRAAGGGVLGGVVQQVGHRPLEQGALDQRAGLAAHLDTDPGLVEDHLEEIHRGGDLAGQRGFLALAGQASLVSAGEEQHVVDDRPQPLQLLQVGLQDLFVMFAAAFAGQRHLGLADQVGQWRAQLVGDVGIERLQAHVGLLQAVQGAVERSHQLAQLGRQRRELQALRQLPRADPPGLLGQPMHRPQAQAGDPVAKQRGQQHTEGGQAEQPFQGGGPRLMERRAVDGGDVGQPRPPLARRQHADPRSQRVPVLRQLQFVAAGAIGDQPLHRFAEAPVVIARVVAVDPETDQLVLLAQVVQLALQVRPALGQVGMVEHPRDHVEAHVHLALLQALGLAVEDAIEHGADEGEDHHRGAGEHSRQAGRQGHAHLSPTPPAHGSPGRSPCPGWYAAAYSRTDRRAWRAGA